MGTLRYSKTSKERSMDRQSSRQKESVTNQDSIQRKRRGDSIDMEFNENTEQRSETKKKSRVVPSPYMREFWGEHIFAE